MSFPPKSYIVYQCYGSKEIFDECIFSLITFSSFHKKEDLANLEIWIYTDSPERFQALKDCWLPLHYRTIDKSLLAQWRGEIDFVHRVKIEVLRDFTKEREGNVLYLDTDVTFLRSISSVFDGIAQGKRYMHVMEGAIESERSVVIKKLKKYLTKKPEVKVGDKKIKVSLDTEMWNAGVLGFKIGTVVLEEVLSFTDHLHKKYPKHIVEQFAFSYFFQQQQDVKTTGAYILHYWNFKSLRLLLASFLAHFNSATWDELIRYSQLVQIPAEMQIRTNYLEYRSHKDHLVNKKWMPVIPDWEHLLKQL